MFVRFAQEYQNQMKICGSRRCRATLFGMRPSRICSVELVVRLRLHPTPKKRDPKSVSCAFNHVRGASSFVVVSFRNTICELATDNSGALFVLSLCISTFVGAVGETFVGAWSTLKNHQHFWFTI